MKIFSTNKMSVCSDQKKFSNALNHASKYIEKEQEPNHLSRIICISMYVIFVIWSLVLALKVQKNNQIKHIALAVIFPPAYIIAYYLGN